MRIPKFLNRSALILMSATMLFPSCSVEDFFSDKTFEGEEEHYTITDKNSGELHVDEPYADCVARYEANGRQDIEAVEFFADGYCMVTYQSFFDAAYSQKRTVTIHADGKDFKLPSALGKAPEARYDYWYGKDEPRIFKYTFSDGVYTIDELGWYVKDDLLYMPNDSGYQEEIPLEKTALLPEYALTSRLCHKWELQKVLIKIYNGNKLVMSYQMSQSEMEKTCVSDLVFSRVGTFLRHDNSRVDGTGYWAWDNMNNQQMSYRFRAPYVGANSTTVYFSNNNLYLTEEISREKYEEYDDEDEIPYDRVVFLYKCMVKGN